MTTPPPTRFRVLRWAIRRGTASMRREAERAGIPILTPPCAPTSSH